MKEWLYDKINEENNLYNDYLKCMKESNILI